MERGEGQVPGLGDAQRRFDRLEVAHLADQDHVRVLAEAGPQGVGEGVRVRVKLALIDEALLVLVEEFDRVLDRDDMELPLVVDLVEHGGERRRLARAGRASHEDESPRLVAQGLDHRRQPELAESENLVGDLPVHAPDRAPLHEVVGAEAREALHAEGEVELQALLEPVLLAVRQDRVGEVLGLRNRHRRVGQRDQPAVQTHHGGRAGRQVQIRCAHFDHLLEQLMECRICGHYFLKCKPFSDERKVRRSRSRSKV